MPHRELNIRKIIDHWKEFSDKDYQTMINLFSSGDYNWALFLGHLVIEKLLKALYVKRRETHAIIGHDLLRLASKMDLKLTEEQEDWFDRLCTKEFAEEWKLVIENLREWLRKQL